MIQFPKLMYDYHAQNYIHLKLLYSNSGSSDNLTPNGKQRKSSD